MRINIAAKAVLDKILERKRKDEYSPGDLDLSEMLREILRRANKFVPSESGSILLDDPVLNLQRKKAGLLYFVACFGRGSSSLAGTTLPINVGIAGNTYTSGKPYISRKVRLDTNFYSEIDQKTKFVTKSIICAPIDIKGAPIGVIELINRKNGTDYDSEDLSLLKIFAEYTSTLIQNSLDAKRFAELSIRDNLTGLYNDRFFYDTLAREIAAAMKDKKELSLLFLDLDRFKEVNDTYGHLAGSRVLAELGSVVAASLSRMRRATAARYGGDEFIVVLPDTGVERALEYAEGLRKTIQEFVFLGRNCPGGEKALKIGGVITSSIGVANLSPSGVAGRPDMDELREALIKAADTAMYASKERGKNCVTVADRAADGAEKTSPEASNADITA